MAPWRIPVATDSNEAYRCGCGSLVRHSACLNYEWDRTLRRAVRTEGLSLLEAVVAACPQEGPGPHEIAVDRERLAEALTDIRAYLYLMKGTV